MRLLKLVTSNFKKLGSDSFDFTNGLNVIAGDNAQGKSTLLEAIGVALFGVSMSSVKKENIATWGQTKWSTELWFQLPCGTYQLTRTGNAAKLTRINEGASNDLVANGTTPVTAQVEELLGLVAKDWNLFVQSEQGSSAGILKYGAAALNRKVEEFAGVDLIDKVQAEASRQATLNNAKAESNAVAEEVMKDAETALSEASQALQLAGVNVEASVQELEAHGSFSQEKPASSAAMRQQISDVYILSNQITIAENNVTNSQQRVDEAKARTEGLVEQNEEAIKADMSGMATSGKELADKEKALQAELTLYASTKQKADEADLMLDTAQVEHNANWKDFEPEANEEARDELINEVAQAEGGLAALQEAVGKAKATYDNLISLSEGATCPTCLRAKEDHDPAKLAAEAEAAKALWVQCQGEVTAQQTRIKTFKADLKDFVDSLAAYEASIVKLDAAIEADKTAKAFLKALRSDTTVNTDLATISGQLAESRTAYATLQAQLNGVVESNAKIKKEQDALLLAQKVLSDFEDEVKVLNDELEAMPEPPTAEELKAAEQAEADYTAAHSAWRDTQNVLANAVSTARAEHRFQEQTHATAKKALDGLNTNAAAALEFLTLAKKYSRLVQFLRERRQQYLKEVWDTVMAVASRLVRVASKDTITKVGNDEGEFMFEENGILASTASASGAQKAMIGVSLRVGLARALYGKDALLIFDEPTADCKEHNAASLAAMIASSAKQVLLITHRETDQSLAQNIVNVGA